MIEEFYKSVDVPVGQPMARGVRVKFNRYVFEKYFQPRMSEIEKKEQVIQLSKKDKEFIQEFVAKKVVAKMKEWKGFDNQQRFKRETTGASIEYALLKYYNRKDKFDNSIVDKSSKRNYPDLLPLGIICDVKGSSIFNVPLIFKKTRLYVCQDGKHKGETYRCANMIGITDHDKVWLLGIASSEVLEKYSDTNLIMIAEITSKTGFYGAHKLIDLPEKWSDLKKLCLQESKVE
jgi:hypothetical protein